MDWFYFLLPQACTLLLSTDALTNSSLLSQILGDYSPKKRLQLLIRESLFALLSMFCLYGLARGTISVLRTPLCAIFVVAGIAVTLTGMRAILRLSNDKGWVACVKRNPSSLSSFTPIAVPLIIGPSWLAGCCILVGKNYSVLVTSCILFSSWLLVTIATIILQVSIGNRGKGKVLLAIQTVLGLFVTIVGTQFLISGLQKAFL
ncbi:marC integral membrane family protein [Chlamydia ibidis]|uniref:UPF0056 membrane protein n=2 Tax=Chlamydia ibidis TaxID=1405396 RepID=S7J2H9_9CHLA|nr:MarC family protein [Chlamydia ibidis]EPP34438.1 marC integral membrane family protein [Chlamydia ibidis]EQM62499.1 marC integral membrane family protein [Chlamydia ibidis 10-1398/6]